MGLDPIALDEPSEQSPVEPPRGPVVDILGRGLVARAGIAQAGAHALVLPVDGLPVQQQGQPVAVAEGVGVRVGGQLGEGLGHAGEAQGGELIEGGVGEHACLASQW